MMLVRAPGATWRVRRLITAERIDVIHVLHGARNYPFERIPSDLDVDLPSGTGDVEYLAFRLLPFPWLIIPRRAALRPVTLLAKLVKLLLDAGIFELERFV